ncbi:MAG: glycosyltransferase [Cyanobacteria bacterium J06623_5]
MGDDYSRRLLFALFCIFFMAIDIAFSINRTLQVPLLVVINSILTNAVSHPQSSPLRFNIVVPEGDRTFFEEKLHSAFAPVQDPDAAVFRVREFTPPDFLKQYLDTKFKEQKPERRISRYMQYARLFLKDIFPDVGRVIYFDADILVLGDVRSLFATGSQLTPQRYLAAVPQFFPAVFYFSNPLKVWSELRKFKSSFNSGVLLTDLSFWTEETYEQLRYYLNLDAENDHSLYHLGDETVFNIMFKDSYIPLPKLWNCCGYGQLHIVAALLRKNPENMKVIHWSGGHHKPWQSEQVIYADLWHSYLPVATQKVPSSVV